MKKHFSVMIIMLSLVLSFAGCIPAGYTRIKQYRNVFLIENKIFYTHESYKTYNKTKFNLYRYNPDDGQSKLIAENLNWIFVNENMFIYRLDKNGDYYINNTDWSDSKKFEDTSKIGVMEFSYTVENNIIKETNRYTENTAIYEINENVKQVILRADSRIIFSTDDSRYMSYNVDSKEVEPLNLSLLPKDGSSDESTTIYRFQENGKLLYRYGNNIC